MFAYVIQAEMREWLAYQKRKWSLQLQQKKQMRKRRKLEESGGHSAIGSDDMVTNSSNLVNRSLTGFMQHTANSILNSPWQIIQVKFLQYQRGSTTVASPPSKYGKLSCLLC